MRKTTYQARSAMRCLLVFAALFLLFWIALVWSIKSGSVDITVKEILRIVFLQDDANRVAYNVIWKMRFRCPAF